jgi:hypothetical protein
VHLHLVRNARSIELARQSRPLSIDIVDRLEPTDMTERERR